jgi:branched-chain amino acid transport system permease protein
MSPARGLLGFVAVGVLGLLLPSLRETLGLSLGYLAFGYFVSFWIAQATSWNVLSGYSGYFSFGQAAFFGIGVYTSAFLVTRQGWNFFLTIPVAGALAALLGAVIGGLAFRLASLRGEIFALLTLAISFILASIVRLSPTLGAGQGITVVVPEYPEVLGEFGDLMFRLGTLVAVGAVAVAYAVQRSRFGWALASIRDAEDVAEALGVPTFRYKMVAISLTGAIAGIAGSTYALQVGFVTVEQIFGVTLPLLVIVMSVLGGRHHWAGPVLGAALAYLVQDRLAAAGLESWSRIILGAVLIGLILFAPEGLLARYRARPLRALGSLAVALVVLSLVPSRLHPLDILMFASLVSAGVALSSRPPAARHSRVERSRRDDEEGSRGSLPATTRPSESSTTALLECVAVAKSFGGVRALIGVSLSLRSEEILGVVGPNGSGKSTLINVVSGLHAPSSGEIRLYGEPIHQLPPHRRARLGLARTYQTPRPFDSMTVRDNVAVALMFGGQSLSLLKARREADRYLEFVGLSDEALARPWEVNLHQRQLIELARALATQPRILFLDEALAGLNPAEVEAALEVLRAVHASGVTIVIVEHLIRIVTHLATRVVVLDEGKVLAEGEPAAVMRNPDVISAYLGGRPQRA